LTRATHSPLQRRPGPQAFPPWQPLKNTRILIGPSFHETLNLKREIAGGEEVTGMALAVTTVETVEIAEDSVTAETVVDSATVEGTVGTVGTVEGSTVMSLAATTVATGEEAVGGAGRMTTAPGVVAVAMSPPGRGPGSSLPPARSPGPMPVAPLLLPAELPMMASPPSPRSVKLAHAFRCCLQPGTDTVLVSHFGTRAERGPTYRLRAQSMCSRRRPRPLGGAYFAPAVGY